MKQTSYEQFMDRILLLGGVGVFIGIVFLLIFFAYVIRLWMVQTATFKIQKDVELIRAKLLDQLEDDIEAVVTDTKTK